MANWFRIVYARYVALPRLKAFPKPQKKVRTNNKTEFQIYPGAINVKKKKKKKTVIFPSKQCRNKLNNDIRQMDASEMRLLSCLLCKLF